jgi:hypothetical protein
MKEALSKNKKQSLPRIEFPSEEQLAFTASLSVAKRGRRALETQAFLRGTIRARLRRMYPDLCAQEITFKYFQEVASNG